LDHNTDREEAGINEVLDKVDSVIEQVLESTVSLPTGIDSITQAYTGSQQRGFEDYDRLNKHLLAKNLNVSDLEDEKLVRGREIRKSLSPPTSESTTTSNPS
jgi:hypothetical protein